MFCPGLPGGGVVISSFVLPSELVCILHLSVCVCVERGGG